MVRGSWFKYILTFADSIYSSTINNTIWDAAIRKLKKEKSSKAHSVKAGQQKQRSQRLLRKLENNCSRKDAKALLCVFAFFASLHEAFLQLSRR